MTHPTDNPFVDLIIRHDHVLGGYGGHIDTYRALEDALREWRYTLLRRLSGRGADGSYCPLGCHLCSLGVALEAIG